MIIILCLVILAVLLFLFISIKKEDADAAKDTRPVNQILKDLEKQATGTTQPKRRQIDAYAIEGEKLLKEKREEILRRFLQSSVAQDCFTEVCKGAAIGQKSEHDLHITIKRSQVTVVGYSGDRYADFSFSEHGFVGIKKDELCVFCEWLALLLTEYGEIVGGKRYVRMDIERAKKLGATGYAVSSGNVWYGEKCSGHNIRNASRYYLSCDSREDDVEYFFDLKVYKQAPVQPSLKEW